MSEYQGCCCEAGKELERVEENPVMYCIKIQTWYNLDGFSELFWLRIEKKSNMVAREQIMEMVAREQWI